MPNRIQDVVGSAEVSLGLYCMLPAAPPPARTNARTCMVFDHHLLPQPCGVGQAGSHAGRHALQGQGDLAQQGEGAGGRV